MAEVKTENLCHTLGTVVVSDKTEWEIDNVPLNAAPDEIMILSELLGKLDDFDDSSTIYVEKNPEWSANSRAVVCLQSNNGEIIDAPKDWSYFLEVYIAKEVIEMWKDRCGHPSTEDKCRAVIYYTENDAYIECP